MRSCAKDSNNRFSNCPLFGAGASVVHRSVFDRSCIGSDQDIGLNIVDDGIKSDDDMLDTDDLAQFPITQILSCSPTRSA